VNSKKILKNAVVVVFVLVLGNVVWGQTARTSNPLTRPLDVAVGSNLYCAGYVQTTPMFSAESKSTPHPDRIVGAYNEQDGWNYAQNKFLVINGGANQGAHVGERFSVVRPRGEVESRWSHKDRLGYYVQELGVVEIVDVKQDTSVVRVSRSCDSMLLGDLLVPFEQRVGVPYSLRPSLDLFGDPSGKPTGRILMSREGQDLISRDQIVYVDLGAEDNVTPGEYLTVFRPLGKGNLFVNHENETVSAREDGFQSDVYGGGSFSNQAARKSGSFAGGKVVSTEKAKKDRPDSLRKVVGEGMVVNVRERTATVVITRAAQEIHPGDWVEIQ
jgi:hypothetical protein